MRFSTALAALAAALPLARGALYLVEDSFVGTDFLRNFNWEAIDDPTHGRVNYTDLRTSLALNLTYARGDTFVMRADHKTVLDPKGPGRNSVRIRSNKTYKHGVTVFDIRHMPQGCSTWPAAWTTTEQGWPITGEVDVIEGVNDVGPNAMTLHSSPNCSMPATRPQTGTPTGLNCDTNVNYNAGCGVHAPTNNSYGPAFNANGGGIYVLERTSQFVKIWFYPRGQVPLQFALPSPIVDTTFLGLPTAYFPNTQCTIDAHFAAHNIIFDLTLCGDWAGQDSVYASSGCPSNCTDYVNNNPSAFTNAYWDVASVRVYQ